MNIEVWADWHLFSEPQHVGNLSIGSTRKSEAFNFEYSPEWLKNYPFQIDPQLTLYQGRYHNSHSSPNFGIFLDSSPDRWGRTLILRREALRAKDEGRRPKQLIESDFLLAVADKTRMGGLRFKVDGKFQNSDEKNPTPPWTALRELQAAAKAFEESDDDELIRKEIRELFVPGSSLGGARPKANVIDDEQNLWIAKFPSKNDTSNAEGWEFIVHGLAKAAGLDLPEVRLESYVSQQNTLLIKRFDRIKEKRIHFTSAMTQLERRDGEEGASYLEMVDLIIQKGEPAKVDSDLEELWRRIVFSIAVSNTDDHLRNHGFLMNDMSGFKLSPAYDINPNPYGSALSLNISETSNDLNFALAKSVASQFRLSSKTAAKIMDQVVSAVSGWDDAAKTAGFSPRERNFMAPAFRLSD